MDKDIAFDEVLRRKMEAHMIIIFAMVMLILLPAE